ncbi:MAG: hypothetical protein CL526_10860 [Aequorivita sp.]|nr:hypothetical protein [Aequorivita sp.]|tara:strand:- start:133 stop:528 length:396 start_codon:yes stop_codon:yes gene_type:complete
MRKDIEIPKAENIHIVAINEYDEEVGAKLWTVYFINNRETQIETVLVMSRGNTEDKKTTTLRRNLGNVAPKQAIKIEFIAEAVLAFTNEYLVTFFDGSRMFERKFTFTPNSISESNTVKLPAVDTDGILAK